METGDRRGKRKARRQGTGDMICEGSRSPDAMPDSLSCSECSYIAPDGPSASLHRSLHADQAAGAAGVVSCGRCGFLTASKVTLTLHKRTAHAPQRYQCPICGYSSLNARHVTAHVDHCTGAAEEDYTCPYCSETFNRGVQLKDHLTSVHTDERTFKEYTCHRCGYVCGANSEIVSHMRAHRAKKHVHKCDNCLFITVREEALTRHSEQCRGEIPVIRVVRMERRSVDIDNVLYTPPSSPSSNPAPSNIFEKIHVPAPKPEQPQPQQLPTVQPLPKQPPLPQPPQQQRSSGVRPTRQRTPQKPTRQRGGVKLSSGGRSGGVSKKSTLKRCRYCTTKVMFDSLSKLREHHHRAHGISDLTVPFACRQFRCKECSVSFESVHDLREHGESCRYRPTPTTPVTPAVGRRKELLSPPVVTLTPKSPNLPTTPVRCSPSTTTSRHPLPPSVRPLIVSPPSLPRVSLPAPLLLSATQTSPLLLPSSSALASGGGLSPFAAVPMSIPAAPPAPPVEKEEEIVVDECGKQDILNHILQSQRQIGKAESIRPLLGTPGLTGLPPPPPPPVVAPSVKPLPSPVLPKSPLFSLAELQYLQQYSYLYQVYLMNLLYAEQAAAAAKQQHHQQHHAPREQPEAKLELTEPTLTTGSARRPTRSHSCFVTACNWSSDRLSDLKRHVTEQHKIRITSTMLAEWDQQIRSEEDGGGGGVGPTTSAASGPSLPVGPGPPPPIVGAVQPPGATPGNKCTHCNLTLASFDAYVHHLIEAHRNVLGIVSKGSLPNTFNTQLPARGRPGAAGAGTSGNSPNKKPKLTLTSPKLVTECSSSGEKT